MLPLYDRNPTHHLPLMTVALIALNVIVFFFVQERPGVESIQLPDGRPATIDAELRFTFEFAAIPCELTQGRALDVREISDVSRQVADSCDDANGPQLFPDKNVWLAALTSMFLHADPFHLGFNLLFLWIFGNNIEDHLGPLRYLMFYVLAGLTALGAHVAMQPDSAIPLVGASGAIAGVMGAYLMWFPRAPVRTLIFVILTDVRAVWWLSAWFVLQFFTGQDSQVAWAAHVGGFVFGAVVGALVRAVPALCRWAWREPWCDGVGDPWDLAVGPGSAQMSGGRRHR